jgi:hypothetical protein
MGVIELSDRSFTYLASVLMNKYHRVRASAPDGSSPRGYGQNFRV